MSRLESFIRRMTAQRDILDMVCRDMPLPDGPVIELGLGNGRTYDHLRERLPGRRIIAFDRVNAAHRKSMPPEDDLIIGEIHETARPFVGINAALVHADIGSGYDDLDELNLRWLPQLAVDLLAPSGIAASGVLLDHPRPAAAARPRQRAFGSVFPVQAKLTPLAVRSVHRFMELMNRSNPFVLSQFRTENRFPLFLELLQEAAAGAASPVSGLGTAWIPFSRNA